MASHHRHTRRSTLAPSSPRVSGMAVHTDARAGASVAQEHGAEGMDRGALGTRQGDRDPRRRPRPSTAKPRLCGDAAGPWGARRDRSLAHTGDDGGVVAPALRPQPAGDRVHTARRAALPRARWARSGALTAVDGPTVAAAARRALARARDAALRERHDAQGRLHACWRRPDRRSVGARRWAAPHRRRHSSGTTRAGRFMSRPSAASVAHPHGQGRGPPGVGPRRSRRCTPGAGGHAPGPAPGSQPWARARGLLSPAPG
jgi:hypothetical protein